MPDERQTLPLMPLRGYVVFPYTIINLDVGRDKSIAAVNQAMVDDGMIVLAAQRDPRQDDPEAANIHEIGTTAHIKQLLKLPGGRCGFW